MSKIINCRKPKIGAIIQARTGSSRLPNKVFADIMGNPLLWYVCNRISFSKLIDTIIIATTDNFKDNKIEEWAENNNIFVYRGSENDVLSRFYETACLYNLDVIVRVTADDPFKDPELIDNAIKKLLDSELNFVFNNNPPSYPEGLDVEVFDFNSLKVAYNLSNSLFEREHVTQYFFKNLNFFKHLNLNSNEDMSYLRWTIDTIEDLNMTRIVYENLYNKNEIFLYQDILDLIKQKPHIAKINSDVKRSDMYKFLKS